MLAYSRDPITNFKIMPIDELKKDVPKLMANNNTFLVYFSMTLG